jgi:GalNAc-alpha-(1->4)-GalNAc-alpha-(1->3)-diNAcBac-PP-undecaprenol alpha-1,4-N-acetyl-D-galactosaminyltransferase
VLWRSIKHNNITVIGNPIRRIKDDRIIRQNYILNVGRFSREKRQHLIIKLFSELGREDWKLVLVGDGPLLADCQKYASTMRIEDKVLFTGEVNNVEDYYLQSKIFAYASVSEGFPNVLGEALSAGLAAISFNFEAGAEDLIKNEFNGYLVPDGENELYKDRLVYLMENEKIREAFAENSKLVLKKFDHVRVCEAYYQFITGK